MPSEPAFDGAALRAGRQRAGLTQHQLARLVEVAGGERVSRWERGTTVPWPRMVARLAEVLQVDPRDLLPDTGETPTVRTLRLRAGLSAQQVSVALHVSVATYLRWEGGQVRRLPVAAYSALSEAFGVATTDVHRAVQRVQASASAPRPSGESP